MQTYPYIFAHLLPCRSKHDGAVLMFSTFCTDLYTYPAVKLWLVIKQLKQVILHVFND